MIEIKEFTYNGTKMVQLSKSDYIELTSSFEYLQDSQRAKILLDKTSNTGSIPGKYFFRVLDGEIPIKVYREWRGFTVTELAEKTGTSQSYITNIENGKRDGSVNIMKKIAQALNLPIQRLIVELVD